MKRCFNCGELIATDKRETCLDCLNKVLEQPKGEVRVKEEEVIKSQT